MVYREIVSEAKRLTLNEQVQLVEELLHAMRLTTAQRVRRKRKHIVPFMQLRGALKSGDPLPTDNELEDSYVNHLMEKYL